MNESDARLVYQTLSGSANVNAASNANEAFSRLAARYRPTIYGLAFAATGNTAEAEDLTQETLIAAYLGLPHLRDPGQFGAWINGIARNLVRIWYRRRAATPEMDGGHLLEKIEDGLRRSPEERLDRQESLARIREAVQALSAPNQQAITLRYWAQMSYAEIGDTLNVPVSTVKSRLYKAKRQLQQQLGEDKIKRRKRMISVTIGDLYTQEREDGSTTIVPLISQDGRSLPIWIGPNEGQALAIGRVLSSKELYRPITYDLMANMLAILGVRVEKIVVSALENTTFFATVHLALGGVAYEVDARPSDAINLAIRVEAPVFVAEEVMDAASGSACADLPDDVEPFALPEQMLQHLTRGPAAQE